MFLSKTSTCSSKCRYRSKLMFARAREWKNTTLSLPPENKLKNQISTNHTASLVLVFWHTHSERKNMFCLALPMRAPQARAEKIWAFLVMLFWNCSKHDYQANVLVHRLHVGKYTAKDNFRNLMLSVRFSKKYHKLCLKADMFKRKLRFRAFGIDIT